MIDYQTTERRRFVASASITRAQETRVANRCLLLLLAIMAIAWGVQ